MAKGYGDIGNCNEIECKYFNPRMVLNCSYSEDNSKCWKKEQDTITTRKMELYEEMLKYLKLHVQFTRGASILDREPHLQSIIDRATKIEEDQP